MTDNEPDREQDFTNRLRANGVALKNVPNTQTIDGTFHIGDYVAKNPSTWMYVPAEPDDVDVESTADHVFAPYEALKAFDEITVERHEDEMYWCDVSVEIPEDRARREQLAGAVAGAIFDRQQA